jgi:hypothetical protein
MVSKQLEGSEGVDGAPPPRLVMKRKSVNKHAGGLSASLASVLTIVTVHSNRQRPFLNPVLHPQLPSALRPYLDSTTSHETFTKSQNYARHKLNFGGVINALDLFETFVLLTGVSKPVAKLLGLPVEGEGWTLLKGLWDLSGEVAPREGEIWQSVAFVGLMTLFGSVLSIPKELYKNFVMEEKHGLYVLLFTSYLNHSPLTGSFPAAIR